MERQLKLLQHFLRIVIRFLGGNVPPRENEPTAVLSGRKRTERAEQVSAARRDVSRHFDVMGKCMGYTGHTPPKREVLLGEGMAFMVFPLCTLLD